MTQKTRRWLIAGLLVVAGWAIGIPIIVLAAPPEDDPLGEYKNSKQYEASMERIGGKSAVFGAEMNDFLAGLFQAPRLGYTIGVAATAAAAIFLAWRTDDAKSPPARS